MKKSILVAILLGLGWVSTSQAVVIHWAAVTGATESFTYAQLVYVSGASTDYASIAAHGTLIDGNVTVSSGAAVSGASGGVYQRDVSDSTRSGAYYVVLFNASGAVAVSKNYLDTTNPNGAIGYTPMNPGGGVFTGGPVGGPTGWAPVPEPGTLALVGLGVAALVIRRMLRK